jgi:predicted ATPase/DNA-binding winged helix-turn-helix (wHTH) protein
MTGDGGNNANKPTGYRFGAFRLYPAQRLLLRGEDKVPIGSTDFRLLQYLVENSGREIGKGELRQGVWHHDALEDSTMASHMTVVRDWIGAAYIDTVIGVGYQFVGTCEPLFTAPPAPVVPPAPLTLPQRPASAESRAGELAEAAALGAGSRLLTIVGPAGIGKSWLAGELAWRMLGNFPDGAHWIDLAPVKEASAVASATAKALGVALRGGVSPIDAIAVWLDKGPNKLLIFDGCEYVAGPAANLIEALLARAPLVSILATSQEILPIGAETVFRLEPMTPQAAATLFVERIRAALPAFALEDEDAAAVAEICRRLDFMPLALVLAASLVPALGLAAVQAGLDERFRMLTTGLRTAPGRQQTLLAAVEWSHGLLQPADQLLFRRLARFSGSFSAEAALAVAGEDGTAKLEASLALRRLVDKSLLLSDGGKPPRYRMLETLQVYALERLQESGEFDTIAKCHAR